VCFTDKMSIPLLHNGDRTSCSFGTSKANNAGFWKYKAAIAITLTYEGWFGKTYEQNQEIYIVDSDSFTDGKWS